MGTGLGNRKMGRLGETQIEIAEWEIAERRNLALAIACEPCRRDAKDSDTIHHRLPLKSSRKILVLRCTGFVWCTIKMPFTA